MAKKNNSAMAIELNPGANIYINCEQGEPQPPDGFVNNTVKLGRLQPDGTIEWYGTQDAFPEGCDDHYKRLNGFGRQPGNQEGEDNMPVPSRKPEKAVLEALFKECDYVILRAAKLWSERSGIRTTDVVMRGWLIKDGIINPPAKPTVNPEFDAAFTNPRQAESRQAAGQEVKENIKQTPAEQEKAAKLDPAQVDPEPADNSISKTDNDTKPAGTEQLPAAIAEKIRNHAHKDDNFNEEFDNMKAKQDERGAPFDDPAGFNPASSQNKPCNDITAKSQMSTPYWPEERKIAPIIDLAAIKIILIETAIRESAEKELPAELCLSLIGAIKDLEVGA